MYCISDGLSQGSPSRPRRRKRQVAPAPRFFIAASAYRQGARHEEGSRHGVYTVSIFHETSLFLLSEEAADAAEEEAAEERDFERESVTSFVMSVPP